MPPELHRDAVVDPHFYQLLNVTENVHIVEVRQEPVIVLVSIARNPPRCVRSSLLVLETKRRPDFFLRVRVGLPI